MAGCYSVSRVIADMGKKCAGVWERTRVKDRVPVFVSEPCPSFIYKWRQKPVRSVEIIQSWASFICLCSILLQLASLNRGLSSMRAKPAVPCFGKWYGSKGPPPTSGSTQRRWETFRCVHFVFLPRFSNTMWLILSERSLGQRGSAYSYTLELEAKMTEVENLN